MSSFKDYFDKAQLSRLKKTEIKNELISRLCERTPDPDSTVSSKRGISVRAAHKRKGSGIRVTGRLSRALAVTAAAVIMIAGAAAVISHTGVDTAPAKKHRSDSQPSREEGQWSAAGIGDVSPENAARWIYETACAAFEYEKLSGLEVNPSDVTRKDLEYALENGMSTGDNDLNSICDSAEFAAAMNEKWSEEHEGELSSISFRVQFNSVDSEYANAVEKAYFITDDGEYGYPEDTESAEPVDEMILYSATEELLNELEGRGVRLKAGGLDSDNLTSIDENADIESFEDREITKYDFLSLLLKKLESSTDTLGEMSVDISDTQQCRFAIVFDKDDEGVSIPESLYVKLTLPNGITTLYPSKPCSEEERQFEELAEIIQNDGNEIIDRLAALEKPQYVCFSGYYAFTQFDFDLGASWGMAADEYDFEHIERAYIMKPYIWIKPVKFTEQLWQYEKAKHPELKNVFAKVSEININFGFDDRGGGYPRIGKTSKGSAVTLIYLREGSRHYYHTDNTDDPVLYDRYEIIRIIKNKLEAELAEGRAATLTDDGVSFKSISSGVSPKVGR